MNDYILRYSLDNRERITIMYIKGIKITQREIQVKRIEEDSIIAHCYTKNAIRKFKKENILAATMLGSIYKNKAFYKDSQSGLS
ncbi:hypothetical protein R9X47_03275 [Wukongibacter baidiensis]|uniref:hypothetical protein n=1 Tax=Wukongibacter baidiensis TaxID=1723361 RepID=UPI003D7F2D56